MTADPAADITLGIDDAPETSADLVGRIAAALVSFMGLKLYAKGSVAGVLALIGNGGRNLMVKEIDVPGGCMADIIRECHAIIETNDVAAYGIAVHVEWPNDSEQEIVAVSVQLDKEVMGAVFTVEEVDGHYRLGSRIDDPHHTVVAALRYINTRSLS